MLFSAQRSELKRQNIKVWTNWNLKKREMTETRDQSDQSTGIRPHVHQQQLFHRFVMEGCPGWAKHNPLSQSHQRTHVWERFRSRLDKLELCSLWQQWKNELRKLFACLHAKWKGETRTSFSLFDDFLIKQFSLFIFCEFETLHFYLVNENILHTSRRSINTIKHRNIKCVFSHWTSLNISRILFNQEQLIY